MNVVSVMSAVSEFWNRFWISEVRNWFPEKVFISHANYAGPYCVAFLQ